MKTIEKENLVFSPQEVRESKPNVNLEKYLEKHSDFNQLLKKPKKSDVKEITDKHTLGLEKSTKQLAETQGLDKESQKSLVEKTSSTFKTIWSLPVVRDVIAQGKNSLENIKQLGTNIKNTLYDSLGNLLKFGQGETDKLVFPNQKKNIEQVKAKLAEIREKNERILRQNGFFENETMKKVANFFGEVKSATIDFTIGAGTFVATTGILAPVNPVVAVVSGVATTAAVIGGKSEYDRQNKENQARVKNLTDRKLENLAAKINQEEDILTLVAYQKSLPFLAISKKETAKLENALLNNIDKKIQENKSKSVKYSIEGKELKLIVSKNDEKTIDDLSKNFIENFTNDLKKEKLVLDRKKIAQESLRTAMAAPKNIAKTAYNMFLSNLKTRGPVYAALLTFAVAYKWSTGQADAQDLHATIDWDQVWHNAPAEIKKAVGLDDAKFGENHHYVDKDFSDPHEKQQFETFYTNNTDKFQVNLMVNGKEQVGNFHHYSQTDAQHFANILDADEKKDFGVSEYAKIIEKNHGMSPANLNGLSDEIHLLPKFFKEASPEQIKEYFRNHNIDIDSPKNLAVENNKFVIELINKAKGLPDSVLNNKDWQDSFSEMTRKALNMADKYPKISELDSVKNLSDKDLEHPEILQCLQDYFATTNKSNGPIALGNLDGNIADYQKLFQKHVQDNLEKKPEANYLGAVLADTYAWGRNNIKTIVISTVVVASSLVFKNRITSGVSYVWSKLTKKKKAKATGLPTLRF
ncbi:MAG: hypothetical protein ACOZAR_01400 [Patescibacteria group bacterium]